jgi:hypothetical protein
MQLSFIVAPGNILKCIPVPLSPQGVFMMHSITVKRIASRRSPGVLFSVSIAVACFLLFTAESVPARVNEWQLLAFEESSLNGVSSFVSNPAVLLAGMELGPYPLHRSTDFGETWECLSEISGTGINCINGAGDIVWVGSSWNRVYTVTQNSEIDSCEIGSYGNVVFDLSVCDVHPDTVLFGTLEGLYRTTDGGGTLEFVEVVPGTDVSLRSIAISGDGTIAFGGTFHNGIYRSTDAGMHWEAVNEGLEDASSKVEALAIDPLNTSLAYSGCHWGGEGNSGSSLLYRTTDGGDTWHEFYSNLRALSIAVDSAESSRAYFGSFERGLIFTPNGGEDFISYTGGFPTPPPPMMEITLFSDAEPDWICAATSSGLWRIDIDIVPLRPEGLGAVQEGETGMRLSWDEVTENEDHTPIRDLLGYVVYRRDLPDPNFTVIDTLVWHGPAPNYLDLADDESPLEFDSAYLYYVTAMDSLGGESQPSAWTEPMVFTGIEGVAFQGKVTDTGVLLEWSRRDDVSLWELSKKSAKLSEKTSFTGIAELACTITAYVDDECVPGESYSYRLSGYTENGTATVERTILVHFPPSGGFQSMTIFPNPFNPEVTIRFTVESRYSGKERNPDTGPFSDSQFTTVKIFNMRGERVCTLLEERLIPGQYSIRWNGRDGKGSVVPSGIYYCRVRSGTLMSEGKLCLLR